MDSQMKGTERLVIYQDIVSMLWNTCFEIWSLVDYCSNEYEGINQMGHFLLNDLNENIEYGNKWKMKIFAWMY